MLLPLGVQQASYVTRRLLSRPGKLQPLFLLNSHRFISSDGDKKLLYRGKLEKRILYLKGLSILSSVGLGSGYISLVGQKGFSFGLAGLGFAFSPFLLSPVLIAWFFGRYVTHLYYYPNTGEFEVRHLGVLLNRRDIRFKPDDVAMSDPLSMLNTFTVKGKPFFLHDEDLKDPESIKLYKKMLKLERSLE